MNTQDDSEKSSRKHKCTICHYATDHFSSYKNHLKTHLHEKPFKCPEFPYRAKLRRNVKRHLETVHQPESRPFPCQHPGCGYAGKTKAAINYHSKIHLEEKSLVCSHANCSYSTNFKKNLMDHARVHTGEKPWVCQFESCSFATARMADLVKHSRVHTKEKPFKCHEPNCEYAATQQSTLKKHRLAHEPQAREERPSFSCPLCEYSGNSKFNLSSHIKSHTLEKLFKCEEPNCSFEARTNREVKRHKVVHSDEKPFACPVESCEFRCKSKRTLSSHLKIHSEEKQYKCELCPYRGKTRSVVTSHLKLVHSDPDFRPYKCPELNCVSTFKSKAPLNKHLLTHNCEKKYSCSFADCSYRAVSKNRIKSHEKNIHREENNEKCRTCEYKCKTKSPLQIHSRTHTKEQP